MPFQPLHNCLKGKVYVHVQLVFHLNIAGDLHAHTMIYYIGPLF